MGSCQSRLLLPALALVSALAGEPAQCPAGSFCPPKSAAPILSPGGQFCPFGSSQPTDCPEKQHCPSNSSRPQQCPAGSFCPSASAAPVICPLGHFCPNGSSEPKKCPAGYRCESHLDIRTLLAPEGLVQWNQLMSSAKKFALVRGELHSMLMVNHQLWARGDNRNGQLGIGSTVNPELPTKVAINEQVAAIAAGVYHSLAVTASGELYTWGSNNHGQLGIGSKENQLTPTRVLTTEKFVAIAAAGYHSLALTASGEVYTWGRNHGGQLGIGNTHDQLRPTKVWSDKRFVAIATGNWHSLALTASGELWTWGGNNVGQLGIGNRQDQLTPIQVSNYHRFVAIEAAWDHSVALTSSGRLWTWGRNDDGQLGIGSTSEQLRPTQVSSGEAFVAISVRDYHCSMALTVSGEWWAWGRIGQFGIGHTNCQTRPTKVLSNQSCAAAAVAVTHLYAWGNNGVGQLGIGNTERPDSPTKVSNAFFEDNSDDAPKQFLASKWRSCDEMFCGEDLATTMKNAWCEVSPGSAVQCGSVYRRARHCSAQETFRGFLGASEALPCEAGTYCPEGKGFALPCPEGHFCNRRAGHPEPCASGWVCPAGTSNETTPGVQHAAAAEAGSDAGRMEEQQVVVSLAVMIALVVGAGRAFWGKGSKSLEVAVLERDPSVFPVTRTVQDGKRLVAVECAGVSIHNVRIEYDGRSKGRIQIDRKEALGLRAISWERDFQFDDEGSWFEWLQSETRCEDGLLVIPFQPVAPQRQVLRVPQVFHMGDDPCDDAPETTDAKASKSEVVSVTSFDLSSASKTGSSWQRC
ncbi:unnamed protein product [Durusdinium trenchii]|uniref:RCC1-like domain-containing protein n=1 Tax=Durusdinium trenchii TaxID=1381693 RepID=A0ABP0QKQ7_9DINO